MPALVTAVVLLTIICVLNTAILARVIRQLRRHSELLWEVAERGVPARALAPGSTVGRFAVRDTDGALVTDSNRAAATLIVFLSPTCASCRRLRTEFPAVAARWAAGRENVIAVVAGPDATATYAAKLAPVARIVVDNDEVMRAAFGVRGFPAIFVLAVSGELAWTGLHADAIPGIQTGGADNGPETDGAVTQTRDPPTTTR